jgi:2-keto-3-deoxy-L-rhamnonate aldolase RhmA
VSESSLKERLHAGEHLIGAWITLTDACVTEMLCGSGFDFLIIESEHTPQSIETVQRHIMATKSSSTAPMVRVSANDPVLIKPVLDAGAVGVLVPQVSSAEDARRAVAACLYPPVGIRGFGAGRPTDYGRDIVGYIERANREMVVWAQIEHIDAVNNLDEILAVPGLDAVCTGQFDLAASMGLLGEVGHPRVLEAIERIIARARHAHVPVGHMLGTDPRTAYDWIRRGAQFVSVGQDSAFMLQGADRTVAELGRMLQEACVSSSTPKAD